MAKIFKVPFAAQGDKTPIPDAAQGDGSVSYNQGFGFDYERPYDDPQSKDIPRAGMNQLFNDLSGAVGEIQAAGVAQWSPDADPYAIGAIVWRNNSLWQSSAAQNAGEPGIASGWSPIDARRLRDATESVKGVAQIATQAQVNAGTDDAAIVTAKKLLALLSRDAGEVAYFARLTPPEGWLKANGDAVSRTTYANLFAAIGTRFGAGNGSTTFALPDLRGEFVRGLDDGRGIDGGRSFGSVQADSLKSHNHLDQSAYGGTPGGTKSASSRYAKTFYGVSNDLRDISGTGNIAGLYSQNTGGAETRPRNVALLACIRY